MIPVDPRVSSGMWLLMRLLDEKGIDRPFSNAKFQLSETGDFRYGPTKFFANGQQQSQKLDRNEYRRMINDCITSLSYESVTIRNQGGNPRKRAKR